MILCKFGLKEKNYSKDLNCSASCYSWDAREHWSSVARTADHTQDCN